MAEGATSTEGASSTEFIETELQSHIDAIKGTVSRSTSLIMEIAGCLTDCFARRSRLLLCGNGGSAADAQHVAAEFVNRFRLEHEPFPALALTTDSSILTSIANDSSFLEVFSRQVEAFGSKSDVLLCLSTSGQSANVLKALDTARARGLITVGLTGEKGRQSMRHLCDFCVVVPSTDTARIQECHEFILHVLCGLVESRLLAMGSKSEEGVG